MSRKIVTVLLMTCLMATVTIAQPGPDTGVRGGDRDRVPVIYATDFNLEKLEGKVVLVAFWRGFDCLTCPPFIEWLSQMQGRYGEDGLIVVAANQDLESGAATDLLNAIHPRSQVVLDPKGRLGAQYEIEGIPSTYLFDRNLNLAESFTGFESDNTSPMEKVIQKLIKKKYKD